MKHFFNLRVCLEKLWPKIEHAFGEAKNPWCFSPAIQGPDFRKRLVPIAQYHRFPRFHHLGVFGKLCLGLIYVNLNHVDLLDHVYGHVKRGQWVKTKTEYGQLDLLCTRWAYRTRPI